MTVEQIDLDKLRKLADAATPGPWEAQTYPHRYGGTVAVVHPRPVVWPHAVPEDAEFIAAAREAVPALLDQLDQAEAERDYHKRENAELHDELDKLRAAHRDVCNARQETSFWPSADVPPKI